MGKSILAQRLATDFRHKLRICGPQPATALDMIRWLNKQERYVRKGRSVLDRATCISTQVYSRVFKKKLETAMEMMLTREVERYIRYGAVFILASTEHPLHDPKEYDTLEGIESVNRKMPEIIKEYRKIFRRMNTQVLTYDWTARDAYPVLIAEIWEHVK
jgi:hypothetical protein